MCLPSPVLCLLDPESILIFTHTPARQPHEHLGTLDQTGTFKTLRRPVFSFVFRIPHAVVGTFSLRKSPALGSPTRDASILPRRSRTASAAAGDKAAFGVDSSVFVSAIANFTAYHQR
jgi:hypothetical protein